MYFGTKQNFFSVIVKNRLYSFSNVTGLTQETSFKGAFAQF